MEAGVTDSEEEVLVVMDLADLSHVSEGGLRFRLQRGAWICGPRFFWSGRLRSRLGDRGFRGRDFGDRRFGRFGPDFFGFGFNGFGFPYYPYYAYSYYDPYYRYPYYYPYPY